LKYSNKEKLIVVSFGPYARKGQLYYGEPENIADVKQLIAFSEAGTTKIHKINLDEIANQLSLIEPKSQQEQDAKAVIIEILENKS